jgi:hypothetical protein
MSFALTTSHTAAMTWVSPSSLFIGYMPSVWNRYLESESFSFSDSLLVEHVQVQSTVQALSIKQRQYVTKTYFPVTCSEDAVVK